MDTTALGEAFKIIQTTLENGVKPSQNSQKSEVKREDQVRVYVRVVFLKVGEIKTVQERFNADVFIQARWREPRLDGKGKNGSEFEISDPEAYWNPKLQLENGVAGYKSSTWQMARIDDHDHAYICERRRINGSFLECMELNQFPFDTQDLTITMTSDRGEHELILQEDEEEISVININAFVNEQEWSLHSHIESRQKELTNAYRNQKHKHPAVSLLCKASRRPNFFIWNFALVQMFICSLIFTTFAVDLKLVPNRLQLSFILLLSNITFKFVVSNSLPKVSYLTVLDKYVLLQMGTLVLVCVWHAVIFQFNRESWASFADKIVLGIIGFCYILIQVGFVLYWRISTNLKRKEFDEKDKQHAILEKRMSMGRKAKSAMPKSAKQRHITPV